MQKKYGLGMVAAAAAMATLAFGFAANAQDKSKPKSKCNAITEETACKADTTCQWVKALMDTKSGKQKRKAYCKTKTAPPKKKEPAKK